MKAAVLYKAQTPLVMEELDIPEPGPSQVMVKMMASGVCHSDWHVVKGEWTHLPLPIILGHEGAAIVEAVGPGVHNVDTAKCARSAGQLYALIFSIRKSVQRSVVQALRLTKW